MCDQKAVIGTVDRGPAAHPRGHTRLRQVDRRAAAKVEAPPVAREIAFVRTPAELRRLAAFRYEAIDRPGVDKLVRLLRDRGHLGIALGDVNHLDAQTLCKLGPFAARI